jgi:hypothetical protein
MRRSSVLVITIMLALAVAPFPETPASASCAAPTLEGSQRLVLERGATVTVEGDYFVDGCRDAIGCSEGLGCDHCTDEPPPRPMEDVGLQLVQGRRTWNLGVADAGAAGDQLGWVTWTFVVPAGAKPGSARLLPEHGETLKVRIR